MIAFKKSLWLLLFLAVGTLLVGLLISNYHLRYEQPQPYQQKTSGPDLDPNTSGDQPEREYGIFAQKVLSKNEISIQNPERALRPGAVDFGEEFLTCMTYEYTEDTPLVEILFSQRGKNGEVSPFKVWTVNIKREDGFPVGGFSLEGRSKLRMGVGKTQEPRRKSRWTLLRGSQYYVDQYSVMNGGRLIRGLQPRFTVPADLEGHQVYRVELILKDEILEQEQLEKEKALARQRQEKAEREKIVIVVRQYPEPNSMLIGLYSDGQKLREFYDEEEGTMTLMGPNKLGGDLMVGVMPRGQPVISVLRPWIYIKNLQKRELIAPDEADLVVSKDELVDVKILLEDRRDELTNGLKKIFFFPYRQAKVPLFCALTGQQNRTDRGYVINMPILPGTYYPEGFIFDGKVEKRIPLGILEITTQAGMAYTVDLQAQPDPALQK